MAAMQWLPPLLDPQATRRQHRHHRLPLPMPSIQTPTCRTEDGKQSAAKPPFPPNPHPKKPMIPHQTLPQSSLSLPLNNQRTPSAGAPPPSSHSPNPA